MYAVLGRPPEDYGKKVRRGLGLLVLRPSGICEEVARVRITIRGDAYLIDMPSRNIDFHESFHRSGEFHWRLGGIKVYPISGALDLPMATRFWLYASMPPCMCIRCDNRRLNKEEIVYGLKILLRLVPIEINPDRIEEYAEILKERGFIRFTLKLATLPPHPYAVIASWNPRHHIDAVRKLLEGTKFEKDMIPLEDVFERLKNKFKSKI